MFRPHSLGKSVEWKLHTALGGEVDRVALRWSPLAGEIS